MFESLFGTILLIFAQLKHTSQHKVGFQIPASSTFERIIDLHHFVFFFLIVILLAVIWLLINLIDTFIIFPNIYNQSLIKNKKFIHIYTSKFFKHMTDFNSSPTLMSNNIKILRKKLLILLNFTNQQVNTLTLTRRDEDKIIYNRQVIAINEHLNLYLKFIFSYLLINKGLINRKFIEDKNLEFGWTLIPCLILATISIPSFYVLYINEEILNPGLTVNIMGHQWYWSFDYTDLFPYWYNLSENTIDIDDFVIDSYMEPEEFLNFKKGSFRLLETEEPLILPTRLHIRLLVSGFDVLHSFAMPAMGLKVDAVPGRLNQLELFIKRSVYFLDNAVRFVVLDMDLCQLNYTQFLI
jgi:heme/copper-type cytochrome/quinol oxidase subunit 2